MPRNLHEILPGRHVVFEGDNLKDSLVISGSLNGGEFNLSEGCMLGDELSRVFSLAAVGSEYTYIGAALNYTEVIARARLRKLREALGAATMPEAIENAFMYGIASVKQSYTDFDGLFPNEREILGLIANGHSASSIADILRSTPDSIRYRQDVMRAKLRVNNLYSLVTASHLTGERTRDNRVA